MTELEIAAIRKEIRDTIREELAIVVGASFNARMMKVPEAAKYLSVDAGWLRDQCKNGLEGSFRIGEGKKNQQYNIDITTATRELSKRGIITKKNRS